MIERLIVDNLSWMKGIAHSFCRNRMDAEDLVGDTILKVLLNADRYDAGKSFRLWVLVIMRNTFRSGMRHLGIVEPFKNIPDGVSTGDPGTNAIASESMRMVEKCAESSVGASSALLFAKGYSYSEIADLQEVTVNIVKSRVHQGRMLITRKLSG